jgi:hypothetical protein
MDLSIGTTACYWCIYYWVFYFKVDLYTSCDLKLLLFELPTEENMEKTNPLLHEKDDDVSSGTLLIAVDGIQTSADDSSSQQQRQLLQKLEASALPAIESYANTVRREDGLDFLDTKNTVLLSYMIELTYSLIRRKRKRLSKTQNEEEEDAHVHRLIEMKAVLDKMRSLDKKLRYQIDKLLSFTGTSSEYATVSLDDPLHYRPRGEEDDDDDNTDASSSEGENDSHDENDEEEQEAEDDLVLARKTLAAARDRKKTTSVDDPESSSLLYRAPRLNAVLPYGGGIEKQQHAQQMAMYKERKLAQRMRASEVAQTLRETYAETPEAEHSGGSRNPLTLATTTTTTATSGMARRLMTIQNERTKYEEDNFVRLTVPRKERLERKKLRIQEASNLSAIADLGNLARESSYGGGKTGRRQQRHPMTPAEDSMVDGPQRHKKQPPQRSAQPRNSLQEALYAGGNTKKKRKTK